MGRLFFLTTLQPDDHGVRIAEDAVHHRFRSEAPETVGIGKTLVGVHTSTYSNLNTPTTKKALSFLLASHFLDKIYPLGMQKSQSRNGSRSQVDQKLSQRHQKEGDYHAQATHRGDCSSS